MAVKQARSALKGGVDSIGMSAADIDRRAARAEKATHAASRGRATKRRQGWVNRNPFAFAGAALMSGVICGLCVCGLTAR